MARPDPSLALNSKPNGLFLRRVFQEDFDEDLAAVCEPRPECFGLTVACLRVVVRNALISSNMSSDPSPRRGQSPLDLLSGPLH
jgi:hypothetical protein